MSDAALVPAVGPRGHVLNHQVNPATGFLENPGYVYDFDSDRKLQYIALIRQGYGKYKACDLMNTKHDTVFKHAKNDPLFAQAIRDAERDYFDTLESVSRTNALEPKMVIERIFQLKNRFPEKYGDYKSGKQEITINMNVGSAASLIEQTKTIDAEIVTTDDKTLSNPLANAPAPDGRL